MIFVAIQSTFTMKRVLFIVSAIIIILAIAAYGFRLYTKSHSPFEEAVYNNVLSVKYSRPYKNDRKIFGGLVPYGEVWRTGANEATVFSTTKDITFGGIELSAGEYSLWTIPNEKVWTVILNSETGQWGVNMSAEANRAEENDVLSVESSVIQSEKVFEQLTITFEEIHEELEMVIVWDQTMVIVPINIPE